MPFPLAIAFQEAAAFFPLSDSGIPDEAECFKPLTTFGRHGFFVSPLAIDPRSQPKGLFAISNGHETMPFRCL